MQASTSISQKVIPDLWFDELVAEIRVNQLAYNQGVMPAKKAEIYESIASNDLEKFFELQKQQLKKYEVGNVLSYYSEVLNSSNIEVNKLAINLRDSIILVWAEVADDNEDTQRELIKAESKVNAMYYDKGYSIDTMIVEQSDCLPVPDHYKLVTIE